MGLTIKKISLKFVNGENLFFERVPQDGKVFRMIKPSNGNSTAQAMFVNDMYNDFSNGLPHHFGSEERVVNRWEIGARRIFAKSNR